MKKVNGIKLKKEVLEWLETLRIKEGKYGRYKLTKMAEPTLFASCFAVMVKSLFDELKELSEVQRQEWVNYILGCQNSETGLFIDPLLKSQDLISPKHDWDYTVFNLTMLSLSALKILGTEPLYLLNFLKRYKNPYYIVKWLEERNWKDPWLEGNNLMYVGGFLIRDFEMSKDSITVDTLEAFFKWLDQHQNSQTGYWGTDKGADNFSGMAGAFHIYLLYFYLNRPLKYIETIIDNTLSFQYKDGLFSPQGGGGSCEDLDAIDILVKMSHLTSYRSIDIETALQKAFNAICRNRNKDGGFCWAKRTRRIEMRKNLFKAVINYIKRPNEIIKYGGWKKMSFNISESDIFSTWFRSLAIALISTRYPTQCPIGIDWQFSQYPGLGFHRQKI